MGIISRLEGPGRGNVRGGLMSGYTGANHDRLTASWLTSNKTADEILRMQLRTLRARSRDIARNNDYAKKFFRLLKINVVGPRGIKFQNRAKNSDGKLDVNTNAVIEKAFKKWSKKGSPTVCGRHSWLSLQNLVIESIARDGEVLIHEVRNKKVNKFGYALQVLEPDLLNEDYNRNLPGGNRIRMSIEFNAADRPVAYHLLNKHPGDNSYIWSGQRYRVIPATDIIHIYTIERATQSRGVPWIHTAIIRLQMLGGYEEAELVAARVTSAKMGFFTREGESEYTGDGDDKGDIIMDAEPGTFPQLPAGVSFQPWDPQHPAAAFDKFVKAILRGASAGMGPGYNSLANDLENVNYSSLRQGALEERDFYRLIQHWLIEEMHERVYESFLDMGLMSGAIKLPYSRIDIFSEPKFIPRGWDWVDPLKESKADTEALKSGLTSRQRILAKRGYDFEDVVDEIAYEQDYAESKGVALSAESGITYKEVKELDAEETEK